jgi:hypothetical protein
MNDVKLPLKSEGRSRAKILTEEAFRETRNYIKVHNEKQVVNQDVFSHLAKKYSKKSTSERNLGDIQAKTSELREILNKISVENFDQHLSSILKYEYNEELMDNFKHILYVKAVTEKKYSDLYLKICLEMFKLFNRKTHPNNPDMNFQSMILKRCKEEFYNPTETKLAFPYANNEEERQQRMLDAKLANIRLISDFYLNGIIPLKVINECFDFLTEGSDEFRIRSQCEMIKKIHAKMSVEDMKKLEKILEYLEDL